jgi:triphosphoribosyl-dephospho-CoA synthase
VSAGGGRGRGAPPELQSTPARSSSRQPSIAVRRPSTPEDIAAAAQLACLLEAAAPKPGNVSPGLHFHDTRYVDFLAAAAAIGPAILLAGQRPLGRTVLAAVEASRRWTRTNANLGMVLLLAPLARAALLAGESLRNDLRRVLDEAGPSDTADVYAAIRLARPGGLGAVAESDIGGTPPVRPLRGVMALAAERDGVAREYATDFAATFEVGVPALVRARADGLDWEEAIVQAYLALLAAQPDSLVARKLGAAAATAIGAGARAALDLGGVRTELGRRAIAQLDAELRDDRNAKNPGTTADLVTASVFVVLLDGGWWSLPGGAESSHA